MPRPSTILLALLGAAASAFACTIPTTPLSNNITEKFQIKVQNPALPAVHDFIMNFRPNGLDMHLVLRPMGQDTYDTIYLENGYLTYDGRHAVIALEYNPNDNTTKMFMTDRTYYPYAIFQPVYACDPDTDELQIQLHLVERTSDPDNDPAEFGGQIGIQTAGATYEFRYSPANNALLVATWLPVNMTIFRDGIAPPAASSTSTVTSTPTGTPSTIEDYDYVSCWAEPDAGRTLTTSTTVATLTNEQCAVLCGGSEYFGTQYSVECWCGATLAAGSAAAPATDCANTCGGDATEICGGGRRLSLYKHKAAGASSSAVGSATSSSSSSSLSSTSSSSSAASSSTFVTSTVTSSSSSSSTTSSSSPSTSSSSSTTSSSLPSTSSSAASSSSSSSSSSSIRSTTSTTSSAAPIGTGALPAVGAFNFVSCYSEPPTGRALTGGLTSGDDMTLEKCAAACSLFPYFGTEWNRECWCGSSIAAGAAPAPLSSCNYPCTGDATEMCGGSGTLSLYHNDGYAAPAQPADVGSYEYYGCVTDGGARTLGAASLSSSTMTLETCATFCSGYTYFGAEWSVECWCGNSLAATGTLVDAGECSMTCGGKTSELCGNGDRLSVYKLAPV